MLKFDLHCHSHFSDGVLAPAEVAARAKANGADVWALTDHDELGGIAQAREAAQALGLHYVPGVEVSVTWSEQTVHIVGLRIDETHPELIEGLEATRSGRLRRAKEIARQLEKAGIPDALSGALKYVDNPELISRTHFARYIVELNLCETISDVFKNYLTEGKPGYAPHRWATLADALQWIRAAGGVAVIAHPGRYKYSDTAFDALLDEFKQLGGTGIEVVTSGHTVEQYAQYAQVAKRFGLLASVGSDFHSPAESRMDVGTTPPLPVGLKPIWHDWAL
jgi:predicted metal-dependent phosphoesterase TrpH